jgi:hypothetical protein
MTLPATNISFGSINQELYRSAGARYSLNDAEGRKLASAGGPSGIVNSGTRISLGDLINHARFRTTYTGDTYKVNALQSAVDNSRYSSGRTWATYQVASGGRIGGDIDPVTGLSIRSLSPLPSFLIDNFTNGDIVEVIVDTGGSIIGSGGEGGRGGSSPDLLNGEAGFPAGTAVRVSSVLTSPPVSLTNSGTIGGGGGGGAGGRVAGGLGSGGGGGGGGGGGLPAGKGGPRGGTGMSDGTNGSSIPPFYSGGAGGTGLPDQEPGAPGGSFGFNGGSTTFVGGGAAGFSIDGTAYVIYEGAGTLRGPTRP